MPQIEIVGFVAAAFTTVSFLPQVIKVVKTGDTHSLSLVMYLVFNIGIVLWLSYGLLRNDPVIITANIVTFALSFLILVYKIRNVLKGNE